LVKRLRHHEQAEGVVRNVVAEYGRLDSGRGTPGEHEDDWTFEEAGAGARRTSAPQSGADVSILASVLFPNSEQRGTV